MSTPSFHPHVQGSSLEGSEAGASRLPPDGCDLGQAAGLPEPWLQVCHTRIRSASTWKNTMRHKRNNIHKVLVLSQGSMNSSSKVGLWPILLMGRLRLRKVE